MSYLLKIVEGPMKGAEIALVDGLRVTVGSSDKCDIVLADATVPAEAFALDVTAAGVTLVRPDGTSATLTPLEIQSFGTTEIAIGPAEGAWGPLTRPTPAEAASSAETPETPVPSETAAPAAETAPSEEAPGPDAVPARKGFWWLWVLLGLISLAVLAYLFLRFVPLACTERVRVACGGAPCARPPAIAILTLDEIAAQHPSLKLTAKDGVATLSGNVARRTERLALQALARAADSKVKLDLTDDETLLQAADALLFAVTEGALKATAASNRVVTLAGFAPNADQLEKAIRALNADVPGIERLVTTAVNVGGPVPKQFARSGFATAGAKKSGDGLAVASGTTAAQLAKKPVYPVAGILVAPYPCVVMTDGLRCFEGGQLGSAVVVKIEADKLTLKEGNRVFEWRP